MKLLDEFNDFTAFTGTSSKTLVINRGINVFQNDLISGLCVFFAQEFCLIIPIVVFSQIPINPNIALIYLFGLCGDLFPVD